MIATRLTSRRRDRRARDQRLAALVQALWELMGKLNLRQLKTKQQIAERVDQLLEKHRAVGLYPIQIVPVRIPVIVNTYSGRT